MSKVKVRDIKIGNKYLVNGVSKELTKKDLLGAGGSGNQEPYYNLFFDNEEKEYRNDWDDTYQESSSGGKRKSRRNLKSKKSRKGKSKKNRR